MTSAQSGKHSDVKIGNGAVVCLESKLRGDITIGASTVVHPRASIIAEAGPIIIGDWNIIEEQACIINRLPPGPDGSPPVVVIGSNNVFEVDCHFESFKMGDNNVMEVKSFVGPKVEITNGCVVGVACKLTGEETLPENTIIFGRECERRVAMDKPQREINDTYSSPMIYLKPEEYKCVYAADRLPQNEWELL